METLTAFQSHIAAMSPTAQIATAAILLGALSLIIAGVLAGFRRVEVDDPMQRAFGEIVTRHPGPDAKGGNIVRTGGGGNTRRFARSSYHGEQHTHD